MEGVIFAVIVTALVIAAAIWGALAARKRREALQGLARRLGLNFHADQDRELARELQFLDRLDQGTNRYAFNILSGEFHGHAVCAFDYHYETHSSDSKGRRQTHHHHLTCFVARLPRAFPELTIAREGFFSKIAQAFGYDDIDFESAEFSRKFCVRSKDKRFAYDVCHPTMMEYLLANPDLAVEIEAQALALVFAGQLKPEAIEHNLTRLLELRSLMPDYLFSAA